MSNTHRWGITAVVLTAAVCMSLLYFYSPKGSVREESQQAQTGVENSVTTPSFNLEPTSEEALADLTEKATGFLEAYFLVKPTDTEDTRRNRVSPFVPRGFIASLNLGLAEGTEADRARVRNRITVKGQLRKSELRIERAARDESVVIFAVPVIVSQRRPNNQTIRRYPVPTASTWRLEEGQWTLESFNEGGDTE